MYIWFWGQFPANTSLFLDPSSSFRRSPLPPTLRARAGPNFLPLPDPPRLEDRKHYGPSFQWPSLRSEVNFQMCRKKLKFCIDSHDGDRPSMLLHVTKNCIHKSRTGLECGENHTSLPMCGTAPGAGSKTEFRAPFLIFSSHTIPPRNAAGRNKTNMKNTSEHERSAHTRTLYTQHAT